MHLVLATVLGFSLDAAPESPLGRALAENNEPCKQSCDAGHDRHCDQQDCHGRVVAQLRPAPHHKLRLRLPLPAAAAPRPVDGRERHLPVAAAAPAATRGRDVARRGVGLLSRRAAALLCCACYGVYHFSYNRKTKNGNMDARERMAYWCCCFLTCWRTGEVGDHWDQEERDALDGDVDGRKREIPPVMLR